MRRLLLPTVIVPALILLLVAPVAAAPPYRENGTQDYVFASSSTCGPSTCSETWIEAYTVDSQTLWVCLSESTYNVRNGRWVSGGWGCDNTSPEALTVNSDYSASLAPTSVDVCGRRTCTTRTVSANLTSTGGPVYSDSNRGTFTDGSCTVRYSSTGTSTEVSGTISIDGSALSAYGSVGTYEYRYSVRCR
ncbi:MAG: hypothetical protein K5924_08980 [Chloroflexi bacterium]|nr:hypothetical protein [Chloroflexota bacterium]